jgi:Na+/H+ antiporter NhaD/arsenite permease-like protein
MSPTLRARVADHLLFLSLVAMAAFVHGLLHGSAQGFGVFVLFNALLVAAAPLVRSFAPEGDTRLGEDVRWLCLLLFVALVVVPRIAHAA